MHTLSIVDDDKHLLFVLKKWFTRKGYDVKTFTNSKEMIESFKTGIPDFILLDVYLSGEHGGRVCQYIKNDLCLSSVVYLYSSSPLSFQDFNDYLADGFVLKRLGLEHLTKVIDSYMTVFT